MRMNSDEERTELDRSMRDVGFTCSSMCKICSWECFFSHYIDFTVSTEHSLNIIPPPPPLLEASPTLLLGLSETEAIKIHCNISDSTSLPFFTVIKSHMRSWCKRLAIAVDIIKHPGCSSRYFYSRSFLKRSWKTFTKAMSIRMTYKKKRNRAPQKTLHQCKTRRQN